MQEQATSSRFVQLADILDAAFHLYRRHLGLFFAIALICFLPAIITVIGPFIFQSFGIWHIYVSYGTLIVCYAIAIGLLTRAVATTLYQPTGVLSMIRVTLPRIFGFSLLFLLPIVVGSLFLFLTVLQGIYAALIVGAILGSAGPSLAVVSGIALVLLIAVPIFLILLAPWRLLYWMYPRFMFIPQVLLLEKRSLWSSLKRSHKLATYSMSDTRKMALVFTGIIVVIPFTLLSWIRWSFLSDSSFPEAQYPFFIDLLALLWLIGFVPLHQAAYTLLYYDYLVRYEGRGRAQELGVRAQELGVRAQELGVSVKQIAYDISIGLCRITMR